MNHQYPALLRSTTANGVPIEHAINALSTGSIGIKSTNLAFVICFKQIMLAK
jgi:hypothetical protein